MGISEKYIHVQFIVTLSGTLFFYNTSIMYEMTSIQCSALYSVRQLLLMKKTRQKQ